MNQEIKWFINDYLFIGYCIGMFELFWCTVTNKGRALLESFQTPLAAVFLVLFCTVIWPWWIKWSYVEWKRKKET
jgi:hypothetical protein